jgi:hypothetical protein
MEGIRSVFMDQQTHALKAIESDSDPEVVGVLFLIKFSMEAKARCCPTSGGCKDTLLPFNPGVRELMHSTRILEDTA